MRYIEETLPFAASRIQLSGSAELEVPPSLKYAATDNCPSLLELNLYKSKRYAVEFYNALIDIHYAAYLPFIREVPPQIHIALIHQDQDGNPNVGEEMALVHSSMHALRIFLNGG